MPIQSMAEMWAAVTQVGVESGIKQYRVHTRFFSLIFSIEN